MKPDEILKEVLNDSDLIDVLKINKSDIESASMNSTSSNPYIEVIKAVIRGGYNGTSAQMIFNEIKRIMEV